MVLQVCLLLALTQSPETRQPIAVVASSKRPGAETVAPQIVARLREIFQRERIAGVVSEALTQSTLKAAGIKDPKLCQGSAACLSKASILLGPKAVVVGVDVGKVGKTLAIHLEAVAGDLEKPLASLDVSSSTAEWEEGLAVPFVTFVREVKAGLAVKTEAVAVVTPPLKPVATPPLPTDVPRVAVLEPQPVQETALAVERETNGKPIRIAPWLAVGGAVAAAGATGTFFVLGMQDKQKYDASLVSLADGTMGSTYSREELNALEGSNRLKIGLGVGSAVATAALSTLAVYLFTHAE
jgi:hypothetical protein